MRLNVTKYLYTCTHVGFESKNFANKEKCRPEAPTSLMPFSLIDIHCTEYSLFIDGLLQPLLEMHRDQFLLHLY